MKIRQIFSHRASLWTLTALLSMAVLLNLFQYERVRALELQADAVTQKAFYETVTLMDGIGSNLEKMMISGSSAKEQELLGSISRQADAAQDNLSMLPAALPSISGALKFVNQLGDYAATLSDRLAAGGAVSDNDHELLMTLLTSCTELSSALSETSDQLRQGQNPFADAPAVSEAAVPLSARTEPAVEYPSLLYDGPFSDGRITDRLLALDETQYTDEQALQLARRFIGEERIRAIRIVGEGSVPVPCYEIEADVQDGQLSLAVTKQGGQVVYMLCDEDPDNRRFSQAELIDLAASFLKSRGYPQTAVSYWSYDDHLLTVNFAVLQDNVILYPDLIKVEMSAETGLAVGFEALNYLANHVPRGNLTPTIAPDDASSLLSPLLTVQRTRLCVIPTDQGEALCYEFSGTANGNQYLVYIDAHTGLEREIYRIIEDEDGQLAM